MRKMLRNGEEWILPRNPGIHFSECCDCGLVHLEYYAKRGKRTVTCLYRDDDETARVRKAEGIVVYRRQKKGEKNE